MPALSPRALALIVLLGAACVLGLAPIFVRLTETGPAAAGFWRFLFALPVLTLLASREGGGVGAPSRWALAAGLFFTLDLSFWHYGIVMTSVANATVLCNLTPVVVTVIGWVFFKETPQRLFLFALAMAMAGALAMAAGADGAQGSNPPVGDLLSLTVSLWYSGYFLAVRAARRTAGAMRVTFWATLVGTPLMLIVSRALGEDLIPAGPGGWAACVGLGVMHVAGQGGVAWALGRLPPAIAAVGILVQPVVAGLLGWWLFGETLTPIQAAGGALILGAILLTQRLKASPRTKTDAATEAAAPVIKP